MERQPEHIVGIGNDFPERHAPKPLEKINKFEPVIITAATFSAALQPYIDQYRQQGESEIYAFDCGKQTLKIDVL